MDIRFLWQLTADNYTNYIELCKNETNEKRTFLTINFNSSNIGRYAEEFILITSIICKPLFCKMFVSFLFSLQYISTEATKIIFIFFFFLLIIIWIKRWTNLAHYFQISERKYILPKNYCHFLNLIASYIFSKLCIATKRSVFVINDPNKIMKQISLYRFFIWIYLKKKKTIS